MNNTENKGPWWKPGVIMFTKVSSFVAIPIIVALFVGKYFDKKYNTDPWIFLSLTFIAFIISLFSIWRYLIKYLNDLNLNTDTENKEKENK